MQDLTPPQLPYDNPCLQKLNRLDWSYGVVVRMLGERIGIRTSSRAGIDRVLGYAQTEGWPLEPVGEPIGALYSLREGPPPGRPGQRNYHLMYLNSARTLRTLDFEELLATFRDSLWALAAALSKDRLVVNALLIECDGRRTLLADPDPLLAEELRRGGAAVSGPPVILEPGGLDRLVVRPLQDSDQPGLLPCSSPARAALGLLEKSITPPGTAMTLLKGLTTSLAAYELAAGDVPGQARLLL